MPNSIPTQEPVMNSLESELDATNGSGQDDHPTEFTDDLPTASATSLPSASQEVTETSVKDQSVTDYVRDLSVAMDAAIEEIHAVNAQTKVLALNARIEAVRAGQKGAAFSVVAEEMQTLSNQTSTIADEMADRTRQQTSNLMHLIDSTIRGTRLSDLALVNIDLVDRNLYERTCDVRWWATDGSLVDALREQDSSAIQYASDRLGVILDAYTVYHDLVLCDHRGRVIANGRPGQFSSVGADVSKACWFQQAHNSRSGDEYGFTTAHPSELVGGLPSLVYSCAVREGGQSKGRVIGVLGILFDWLGLAMPIVQDIPVRKEEQATTEAYLLTDDAIVLASNQPEANGRQLALPGLPEIMKADKGFHLVDRNGVNLCVGHAKAPGFETYSTGWHSLVIQPTEM